MLTGKGIVVLHLSIPCFLLQGIDLKAGGRNKKVHRTAPKSDNPYLKLLVKVRITGGRKKCSK